MYSFSNMYSLLLQEARWRPYRESTSTTAGTRPTNKDCWPVSVWTIRRYWRDYQTGTRTSTDRHTSQSHWSFGQIVVWAPCCCPFSKTKKCCLQTCNQASHGLIVMRRPTSLKKIKKNLKKSVGLESPFARQQPPSGILEPTWLPLKTAVAGHASMALNAHLHTRM